MNERQLWVVRISALLLVVAYWTTAIIQGTPWWWRW